MGKSSSSFWHPKVQKYACYKPVLTIFKEKKENSKISILGAVT